MAYTFNGAAKTITLSVGTVTLDLIDLHSRWKDWVLAGNAKFAQAFSTIGGETPKIPLYLFLSNGWKIIPQSANHVLSVVNGILETDDASNPFQNPAGTYSIQIKLESPGIAIGYSTTGGTGGATADQIWQRAIEGGMSAEQMLRIMLSALAGTCEKSGNTITFKSIDGLANRIIGSFDGNNNRVGVILDGN